MSCKNSTEGQNPLGKTIPGLLYSCPGSANMTQFPVAQLQDGCTSRKQASILIHLRPTQLEVQQVHRQHGQE